MPPHLLSLWARLRAGERVRTSSRTVDELFLWFQEDGRPDDPLLNCVASVPNPGRVGVLDDVEVFVKGGPGISLPDAWCRLLDGRAVVMTEAEFGELAAAAPADSRLLSVPGALPGTVEATKLPEAT